jgi:hypothetical protein
VAGVVAVVGLGGYVLNMGLKENDNGYLHSTCYCSVNLTFFPLFFFCRIKIVSYVIFGLDVLLVLLIIFLRKKIALTCAMIKVPHSAYTLTFSGQRADFGASAQKLRHCRWLIFSF